MSSSLADVFPWPTTYVNSIGSCKSARKCRFAWTFAVRICYNCFFFFVVVVVVVFVVVFCGVFFPRRGLYAWLCIISRLSRFGCSNIIFLADLSKAQDELSWSLAVRRPSVCPSPICPSVCPPVCLAVHTFERLFLWTLGQISSNLMWSLVLKGGRG